MISPYLKDLLQRLQDHHVIPEKHTVEFIIIYPTRRTGIPVPQTIPISHHVFMIKAVTFDLHIEVRLYIAKFQFRIPVTLNSNYNCNDDLGSPSWKWEWKQFWTQCSVCTGQYQRVKCRNSLMNISPVTVIIDSIYDISVLNILCLENEFNT